MSDADTHWILLVDGAWSDKPEIVVDGPFFADESTAIAAAKRAEAHHRKSVRLLAARVVYCTKDNEGPAT